MPRPHHVREKVVDPLVGGVLVSVDLVQDDLLLLFHVARVELGIQHGVRENLDRQIQVLVERARVEARHLASGEGVQMPPDRFQAQGQLVGVAGVCSLEHHVLEEVRHAGLRRRQ